MYLPFRILSFVIPRHAAWSIGLALVTFGCNVSPESDGSTSQGSGSKLKPVVLFGIEGVNYSDEDCKEGRVAAGDQVALAYPEGVLVPYPEPENVPINIVARNKLKSDNRTVLVYVGNTTRKGDYPGLDYVHPYHCYLDAKQMQQLRDLDAKHLRKYGSREKHSCLTKINGPKCYSGMLDEAIWNVPWSKNLAAEKYEDERRNNYCKNLQVAARNDFVQACRKLRFEPVEVKFRFGDDFFQTLFCPSRKIPESHRECVEQCVEGLEGSLVLDNCKRSCSSRSDDINAYGYRMEETGRLGNKGWHKLKKNESGGLAVKLPAKDAYKTWHIKECN